MTCERFLYSANRVALLSIDDHGSKMSGEG